MRKLQLTALAVEAVTLLVRLAPLPDWAVRLNGIVMLAGAGLLVFASVRRKVKNW